ncbi:MAG: hypothetical protein AAGI23_09515 [Bacteroidota bacterium]
MLLISSTTISAWKIERSFPTVNGLLQLSEYFEVNLHALFHADLSKDKAESAKPDYLYGTKTKAEIEADLKVLWEEMEKLKEKKSE